MNEHAEMLQAIMEKATLTPSEVKQGVVACFFAINRDFVKRRLGEVPAEQVDSALGKLIKHVFDEYHVEEEKPSLHALKQAELMLENRIGFETEPNLLNMHKSVIKTLFSRVQR